MDGNFYRDTRLPFPSADASSVTLSTTDKALLPASLLPVLGSNYFGYLGKGIRCRLFGRITTVLTPGNGTFDIYWGTGADANGTIIGSSETVALTASQTNLSFELDVTVRARALGSSGSLLVTGHAFFNSAVAKSVWMVPASAPAAVSVDLSAASIISPQFKRSGSTAETMTLHDWDFESLN